MQIDIGTVLRKLDDTVDEHTIEVKEFGLRFITADGRLRTMRCRKNVKAPQQPRKGNRGGVTWNLKRNAALLVQDLDQDQPRSLKFPTICGFKDFKSNQWLRVFH